MINNNYGGKEALGRLVTFQNSSIFKKTQKVNKNYLSGILSSPKIPKSLTFYDFNVSAAWHETGIEENVERVCS